MTRCSTIIPCYNSGKDVVEAVESVRCQTARERVAEIIVVDDGSDADTRTMVRALADKHSDVTCILQENQGPSAARNRGVEEATAPYVAFLDADDVWYPDKLERQFCFLNEHPSVALLCSDFAIEQDGHCWRARARHLDYRRGDNLESLFLRGGPILMSTVVLRRSVFEEVGGFDLRFSKGQDTDLWLRIAAEHRVHHLPSTLVVKRVREGSVGEDMVAKVRYLRQISAEIVEKYPRLEPLHEKRQAILGEMLTRYWLEQGNRQRAREEIFRAVRLDAGSVQRLLLLGLTLLPLPTDRLVSLLYGLGRVRRELTRLKTQYLAVS